MNAISCMGSLSAMLCVDDSEWSMSQLSIIVSQQHFSPRNDESLGAIRFLRTMIPWYTTLLMVLCMMFYASRSLAK